VTDLKGNAPVGQGIGDTKLSMSGVSKSFGVGSQAQMVLDDINLSVRQGEFLSLCGPSGCGKSTLLNIIAGLTPSSSGEVVMSGNHITGPGPERGVLFQDYALFPWKSVRENIAFGLKFGPKDRRPPNAEARDNIVAKYVELVGLNGSEHKYPKQLSGGMRQRTALARLWAPNPEMLLMDEPLAALDAQTRIVMQEELLRIWGQTDGGQERKTVVYVTHSIEEAVFLSDRVAVMGTTPGHIKAVIDVDLPRPRTEESRGHPAFEKHHLAIWHLIKNDAIQAVDRG